MLTHRSPQLSSLRRILLALFFLVIWRSEVAAEIPPEHPPLRSDAHLRLPSFADVVEPAVEAVVQITTTPIPPSGRHSRGGVQGSQALSQQGECFAPHCAPGTVGPRRSRVEISENAGTGFIISTDGEILTNFHVVDGAGRIHVRLANDRQYEGRVIGVDPLTDIALLKISADEALPTIPLGRSAELRLGDWVVAIGNPFGFAQTVTVGIVSGKGRTIGAGPYDDFIQTDAPINPGSSGGPLLNLRGEVVGITAEIVSPLDGNVGIAFATPMDLVQQIAQQLKEHGVVTRGWLGLTVDHSKATEVRVVEVTKNGPADKAGVRRGDVITAYNDQPITAARQFTLGVAQSRVGQPATLTIRRGQQLHHFTVSVGKLPMTNTTSLAPLSRRVH